MKKIIYTILIIAILTANIVPAFAWDAEDYYEPSGENILVPMQTPVYAPETGFAEYTEADINDPYGKAYGEEGHVKVYKGEVDVSSAGKRSTLGKFGNYAFVNGKYKVSLWFMEGATNADKMTRMLRLKAGESWITNPSGTSNDEKYLYFTNNRSGITLGEWVEATLEFEVNSTTNNACSGKKDITFTWECANASEGYDSLSKDGDFYLYIADVKIFKYPHSDLSVSDTNDGDTMPARESAFEAEFSVPVNGTTVEKVTINDVLCDKANLDISTAENKLIVKPKNGFLPGSTNTVKIEGVTDIFGREYETPIIGTVTASNYSEVVYGGEADGNFSFSVTNKMKNTVDFYVAVFYYSGTEIKDIKYSVLQSGVVEDQTVSASVPAISNTENWSKKAWVISTTQGAPMILARELEM